MELLNSVKPVLRLPFRSRLPVSFNSTQTIRSLTTTSSVLAPPTRNAAIPNLSFLGSQMKSTVNRNQNKLASLNLNPDSKHPQARQPWHLHCYAHKHNTHLTLTRPNRQAVISISAGQIGFKKAARGGYDAAYQLGAYFMARVQRAGLAQQIDEMEFVLRGFGQGREAFTKILTGTEGAALRHKVTQVTDATRLKFGGTRSPRPRRLG